MVSPSAVCTVNGTPIPTSGTSGINVAPGSTITIALVNRAGVNRWDVNCTMSDGINPLSAFPLVQATKNLDNTNFTCTFVMPALYTAPNTLKWGSALQFVSVVNSGEYNQNTFTFGVFIIGDSGIRLVFDGENLETNATYGVAPDINEVIVGALTSLPIGPAGAGGGDLGGFYPDPFVRSISGYTPGSTVKIFTPTLEFDKTESGPTILQEASTTFMAGGQTLTIKAQDGGIDGAGGNLVLKGGNSQISSGADGGSVILSGGLGTNDGHVGNVRIQNNGVDGLIVGPSLTAHGSSRNIFIEYPIVYFEIANIPESVVEITTTGTSGTPQPLFIHAGQSGISTGGALYLSSGDGNSGANNGTVYIKTGALPSTPTSGLEVARFNPSGQVTIPGLNVAGVVHNNSSGDLSTSLIVNADVSATAAIAYSKLNLTNSIVNADVNTAAAISVSKLASGTSAQVLLNNATPTPTWTTLSGDMTVGSTGITLVSKINGATVPAAGSLTTGNVLQVNGASSLTYGPVNLAGGSNYVTGSLPAGNQSDQTMGGDVTGTTGASTVVKLRGKSLNSSLATLGVAQDGYILTWVNGSNDWEALPNAGGGGGGSVTWTDDLLGSTNTDQKVRNITGDLGFLSGPASTILVGDATNTYETVIQDRSTAYKPFIIRSHNAASAGDLFLAAGNSTLATTGVGGNLQLSVGTGDASFGLIQVVQGGSNSCFNYNNTSDTYNYPTDTFRLGISNIAWHPTIVAPTIIQNQLSGTGTTAGRTLTIQAQQGQTAAGGTNNNGGAIVIQSGAKGTGGSGGTPGTISLNIDGTTYGFIDTSGVWRMAAYGTGILHSDSSGNLTSSTIVNADVNASAAIAYSKLNLTGSIVDADVNASAAIAGSKINPNFGSQALTAGTSTLGTTTSANTVAGSITFTTKTFSTTGTIDTTTNDMIVYADTTSAAFTLTLPTPTNGRTIILKDKKNTWNTNNLTLGRHGTEKIDNSAANLVLSSVGSELIITSDGTDWYTSNSSGGGSGITALTGDVVASGSGSVTATIHTMQATTTVTKTGNYTITTSDFQILVNPSGAFNLTLPTPAAGMVYHIWDISGTMETNNVTLVRHASEKISGVAASRVLAANWGHYVVTSDGTDWYLS